MSFSSRRRNYMLVPHRRDGLIEWMKSMLMHSFVLNALDSTCADTFEHFEILIEEHRQYQNSKTRIGQSRLKHLVPTVGDFHTPLPLRRAFHAYNAKYALTSRRHICITFNELRHILNLAQIMALAGYTSSTSPHDGEDCVDRWVTDEPVKEAISTTTNQFEAYRQALSPQNNSHREKEFSEGQEKHHQQEGRNSSTFQGPTMISFDGDQTLYSDGENFESNPTLAHYIYLLLKHGVTIAVVTAAGYEYHTEKYEFRLSGLLKFFEERKLTPEECDRFYLFGGECNYLLKLGSDYHLHPVKELGPGGWMTATRHTIPESPGAWKDSDVSALLDIAENTLRQSSEDQRLRSRVIRKKRGVGLVPQPRTYIPREALDETVLRVQECLRAANVRGLPYCAFNGGKDCWVDVGNKKVAVQVLQCYLGLDHPADDQTSNSTLHIGDQFLNTGNDFAARGVCPCVWITSPEETTYILKSILRLAGVSLGDHHKESLEDLLHKTPQKQAIDTVAVENDLSEVTRRTMLMDVYTGEMIGQAACDAKLGESKINVVENKTD